MPDFDPTRFGLPSQPALSLRLGDPGATRRFGACFGRALSRAGWIGLVGNLGAGKTTFVQGLVEALDETAEASSPTYTLLNEYHTRPPVWHFDLYRLDGVDDLETVGYWDYAEDRHAVVVVEWIDRIPDGWPGEGIVVRLEHGESGGRTASLWGSVPLHDLTAEIEREFGEHP